MSKIQNSIPLGFQYLSKLHGAHASRAFDFSLRNAQSARVRKRSALSRKTATQPNLEPHSLASIFSVNYLYSSTMHSHSAAIPRWLNFWSVLLMSVSTVSRACPIRKKKTALRWEWTDFLDSLWMECQITLLFHRLMNMKVQHNSPAVK